MSTIYVDQALTYSERLSALEGWFLEGWEEFCLTSQNSLPDPADYLTDAAALVAERLEGGCWVVPGTSLYALAALLALEECGWVEEGALREEALRPLLYAAEAVDDEKVSMYHLVLGGEDE